MAVCDVSRILPSGVIFVICSCSIHTCEVVRDRIDEEVRNGNIRSFDRCKDALRGKCQNILRDAKVGFPFQYCTYY